MSVRYVDPYATSAYEGWVSSGKCSAIHRSKAWCNKPTGHAGDHASPYADFTGAISSWLSWGNSENHPQVKP